MIRTRFIIVMLPIFIQACAQHSPNYGDFELMASFPKGLKEVSGMATLNGKHLWVIEDSGNEDRIYALNFAGKMVNEFQVKNAQNKDWEELTTDKKGNLYVGDFGNNRNDRKDLAIYKLPNPEIEKGDKIEAEKIKFRYPQQKAFPPKKKKLYYDTEAFFHWQGQLYIFTKNRTRPYTGKTLMYRVPDKKGSYDAEYLGALFLCDDPDRCSVTSADISEDGKKIVLLGYGRIFLLTHFDFEDLSQAQVTLLDPNYESQMESILFLNDSTLLIADEKTPTKGRKLYEYNLE